MCSRPSSRGNDACAARLLRTIRGWAIASCLAFSGAGQLSHAQAHEIGLEEPPGDFVLELEAPSSRTRGRCAEVSLSNFGTPLHREVQLVARLPPHRPDGPAPAYESLMRIATKSNHSERVQICLAALQTLVRYAANDVSPLIEVAVFRIPPPGPAARDWAVAESEDMRLSLWLALPDRVWRLPVGNLAKTATGR